VAAVPVAAAGGDSQRFAAAFAYTLLTYSPERAEQQQVDLAGMLAKNLNAQDAIAPSSRPQRVVAAWPGRPTPTRSVPGDPRGSFRSIVVVTCVVARRGHMTTMNLSVPILDDGAGGLAVTGYPAVVPPSLAANVAPKPQQPLADSESHAIGSFLNRFFDQYLAAAVIPELLTPAAVRHQRVPPLGEPFTLVSVEDVQQLLGTPTAKWLAVRLVARDTKTRATFTLSYWLRVIYRGGHWLVDDLKR
jgi:hypothetical protein